MNQPSSDDLLIARLIDLPAAERAAFGEHMCAEHPGLRERSAEVTRLLATSGHPAPTPTNPLGIKGAGEAGTVGAMPCVHGAILDALAPLGIRWLDMPASPHRVWRAIRQAKRKKAA